MGIEQLSRLGKLAKVFVKKHNTALQWAVAGTATIGMWGGIFLVEKQVAETTRRVHEAIKQEQQAAQTADPKLDRTCQPARGANSNPTEAYIPNPPDPQTAEQLPPQQLCDENTTKELLQKYIKLGQQADTIGNVVFDKGLVKNIEIQDDSGFGVDGSPMQNATYSVTLSDGSNIKFVPQYATNRARVSKRDGSLVFEGLNRMYFSNHHYENEDYKYSNLGKYKFIGCQGFVNTSGKAGEQVTSEHRKMPDGLAQKSCLYLCDERARVPEEKDIYHVTENDRLYGGN